jgi:hypothetical protein
MIRKIRVDEPGDTDLLPGGVVSVHELFSGSPRPLWQPNPSCQPRLSRRPQGSLRKPRLRVG